MLSQDNDYPSCPKCENATTKDGKSTKGVQVYLCRGCGHKFVNHGEVAELAVEHIASALIEAIHGIDHPQKENWVKFIKKDTSRLIAQRNIVAGVRNGTIKLKPGGIIISEYKKSIMDWHLALKNIKRDPQKIAVILDRIL